MPIGILGPQSTDKSVMVQKYLGVFRAFWRSRGTAPEKASHLDPQYLFGWVNAWGNQLVDSNMWSKPAIVFLAVALSVLVALVSACIPFSRNEQLVFSLCLLVPALYLRRYVGTMVTLILIGISMVASTRYLVWRFTVTLGTDFFSADLLFGLGLLGAEFYAWLVLIFGFFQTIWPLRRKPLPMPADTGCWPSIDIFIPTYNEPLSVVRPTVMAALALDWPRDKLKVYILDDGRRAEFGKFAEQVGSGYITRDNNRHAKAGNINQALPKTNGDLIAIFDCDHIPTRSFLQLCGGWFMADPKLAMLQTPHHFLSPDPFERNLGVFRDIPNEGNLFYGLVQDGNDFWNSAFFCGSCAVIRRDLLLEIGGVAVETVTEDAHTALKLHRLGYNTAFLGVTQAAGLATESLSAHVGQRIRWARGMAQIFRIDNPLLGRGLTFAQRICYLNAMMHFFYGLPRIVFLTAPLAYLFFEAHVIQASADLIAAYALPHLIHANMTNSRMQGAHRHSFWAEVYETSLAWYILVPTTLALINPKFGKFNVTAKGGQVFDEYFDWKIASPYIVILALNVVGLFIGFGRLFWWNAHEQGTVLLNLIWTLYNITILGATLAVAQEARQVRSSWRVQMELPAMLMLPNGRTVACKTVDFSEGGFALSLPVPVEALNGSEVNVSLFRGEREFSFPAITVFNKEKVFRVRFEGMSLENYRQLVAATFSRGDAWLSWRDAGVKTDAPIKGLVEVSHFSLIGLRRFAGSLLKLVSSPLFASRFSSK